MLKLTLVVIALALAAGTALGQAPTLRIVQPDGPNLPADLYYGNIKVKPLRLRPGTNQVITIDDADFFVNQQYVDFLSRFRPSLIAMVVSQVLNFASPRKDAKCL